MLYRIIKFFARVALHFYCRKLVINNKILLDSKGPLLIAANHPNSFLDAIIIDTLFKQPVTALTRGDVFKNKFFRKILFSLNMLPVYRVSEGAENLEHNYTTFEACNTIFKQGGIVLIFSEGRCINEWHLRPLKKGTSRLALSAWQQGIPLKVLPLGINYNSFKTFGKTLHLNFGQLIDIKNIPEPLSSGLASVCFNKLLHHELSKVVYELPKEDTKSIAQLFSQQLTPFKKIFLFIPAVVGYFIHFPLYFLAKSIVRKRPNDHYDSIIVGFLFFAYPMCLLIIAIIAYLNFGLLNTLLILLLLPFTAWALIQLKN